MSLPCMNCADVSSARRRGGGWRGLLRAGKKTPFRRGAPGGCGRRATDRRLRVRWRGRVRTSEEAREDHLPASPATPRPLAPLERAREGGGDAGVVRSHGRSFVLLLLAERRVGVPRIAPGVWSPAWARRKGADAPRARGREGGEKEGTEKAGGVIDGGESRALPRVDCLSAFLIVSPPRREGPDDPSSTAGQ